MRFGFRVKRNAPGELPGVSARSGKRANASESGGILIFTTILTTAVLSFGLITVEVITREIVSSKTEYRSMQAEYIAEAGLERAMRELKNTWASLQDWSDILDGPDDTPSTSDDGELSFGRPVSFNGGSYSVVVTDNDDGDSNLFMDSDGTVVITSAGSASGGTSKTIEAEVTAKSFVPGASIYLDGTSEMDVVTEHFEVSGDDYNIWDLSPTTVGAVYGISTSGSTFAVEDQHKDNITGKDYDPIPDPDVPSTRTSVSDVDVQELISYYSQFADTVLDPGTYNQAFGTSTDYEIVYVTGDAVFIGSHSSYGLLICDGNLTIKGKHNWVGLIIAKDTLTISGTGSEDDVKLYGAAYVGNSSGADGAHELLIRGKSKVYYSSEAIDKANGGLPLKVNYWSSR